MVWDSSWQQPGIKENALGMARVFEILKTQPPETPLWTKPHLLILPRQFYLLGPCLHVSPWRPCWSTPSNSHCSRSLHLKEARCNSKPVWNAKSQSTPNLLKQKQKQNRVQATGFTSPENFRKPVFYKRFNDAIPIPSCSALRWDQIQTNQTIN